MSSPKKVKSKTLVSNSLKRDSLEKKKRVVWVVGLTDLMGGGPKH